MANAAVFAHFPDVWSLFKMVQVIKSIAALQLLGNETRIDSILVRSRPRNIQIRGKLFSWWDCHYFIGREMPFSSLELQESLLELKAHFVIAYAWVTVWTNSVEVEATSEILWMAITASWNSGVPAQQQALLILCLGHRRQLLLDL